MAIAAVIDDGTDLARLEDDFVGATYTFRDMTCALGQLMRAFDRANHR